METHFHSFPHQSRCNRALVCREKLQKYGNFYSGKISITVVTLSLSLSLSFSPFYIMNFFSSLSGGLNCGSVFRFVSCKSSSSLSTETLNFAFDEKKCFSDKTFSLLSFFLSHTHSLSLFTGD